MATGKTGDDFAAAAIHHLIDIGPDPDLLMAPGHRNRIIVGPVAHQGLRGDPPAFLIAGLEGCSGQRLHGREIARSEEHTSELQTLMRIPYAVFCLKQKRKIRKQPTSENKIIHYTT